eukprot:TRINITY_DN468_c0_g1_i1.p1 TRINITY_DN468_c0_g1~~TRINITY_DN468_c0_g1_i1.p1  ORF type:complete len:270 (-),score=15.01 TRINITY_DN468_c0_g1_i1:114-923(-)
MISLLGFLLGITLCGGCYISSKPTPIIMDKGVELMVYEGLTCSDTTMYLTGAQFLMSTSASTLANWTLYTKDFKANYNPLPAELILGGYDHIGDIDYHNGNLFAPIENKNFKEPLLAVYGAASLELVTFAPTNQSHMPWVAGDWNTGLLYSSEFSTVNSLYVYDSKTLTFIRNLTLTSTLHDVQGGVVVDGYLYLTSNPPNPVVQRVELHNNRSPAGTVVKISNVPIAGPEAEGIAHCPAVSGAPYRFIVMTGKAYQAALPCLLLTYDC